ncbi:MAG: glycosyltransferase [Candidatus Njordarchaeales archaeon]
MTEMLENLTALITFYLHQFVNFWTLSNIILILFWIALIVIIISSVFNVIYYWGYKFKKVNCIIKGGISTELPIVSILMPIRSETLDVIERSVKQIIRQAYPKEKIELIIISDDEATYAEKIKRVVENLAKNTIHLKFIWRENPKGKKAGALNDGLRNAIGKYIVTIDADTWLPEDYIIEIISYLENEKNVVAAISDITPYNKEKEFGKIQVAAWSFLKKTIFCGRQNLGFTIPVVGMCSVIKKAVLEEIGGWDESIVADDLGIWIRIMIKKYKTVFLPNVCAHIEVPETYKTFKNQQRRWAFGGVQVLRKYFRQLIFSDISLITKLDALFYLLMYQFSLANLLIFPIALLSLIFGRELFPASYIFSVLFFIPFAAYTIAYFDSLREDDFNLKFIIRTLGSNAVLLVSLIPTILISTIKAILGIDIDWRITPKGKKFKESGIALQETFIGLFLVILSIYGIAYASVFITGLWLLSFGAAFTYTGFKTYKHIW